MTTSGIYTITRKGTDIIESALRKCGVVTEASPITAPMQTTALAALEDMIRAMHKDGIKLWLYRQAVLFPVLAQKRYLLGPNGDHFCFATDLIKTTLAVAASDTDTSFTVSDDEGLADNDYIGIELDSGVIFWTTINGAPAANVVTVDDALTGDAAIGNKVFSYTSKAPRPLEITHGSVQVQDDSETFLKKDAREDYLDYANKAAVGTPIAFHYNPLRTDGELYLYPTTNNETQYINFSIQIPVEIVQAAAKDLDFPEEWYLPLSWCLAQQLYIEYGITDQITVTKIEKEADKWYDSIKNWDQEDASIFFEPDDE